MSLGNDPERVPGEPETMECAYCDRQSCEDVCPDCRAEGVV